EGWVTDMGETTAGMYVLIGAPGGDYRLFFPRTANSPQMSLRGFAIGDKVRATGVALQFCPSPPFNRWFEMLVGGPADLVRVRGGWFLSPYLVGGVSAGLLLIGLLLWTRERRLRAQRERLRRTFQ